jgi:tripartite-type tricarboxylate transporter receptor subunit TctC
VNKRRQLIAVLNADRLACSILVQPVSAQTYPIRPVRLIVPYPPGGATDFTAREIAAALSESMVQQFVVDNRSGAARTMGHHVVAKAAPDTYALVVGTFGGLATVPA